jgi:hypothetical protein
MLCDSEMDQKLHLAGGDVLVGDKVHAVTERRNNHGVSNAEISDLFVQRDAPLD